MSLSPEYQELYNLIINKIYPMYQEKEKKYAVVSKEILMNALEKAYEYLKNYFDGMIPNAYKRAGAIAFFIRKLKPFWAFEMTPDNELCCFDMLVNERIGWFCGLELIGTEIENMKDGVHKEKKRQEFRKKIQAFNQHEILKHDLYANLAYGSMSPTSLSFMYQLIFDLSE